MMKGSLEVLRIRKDHPNFEAALKIYEDSFPKNDHHPTQIFYRVASRREIMFIGQLNGKVLLSNFFSKAGE